MSRRRTNPNAERRLQRGPAARWRGNRVFYVAVEGERTEPDYLSYLNREFGQEHQFFIRPLYRGNGMTPAKTVTRVLEERERASGEDNQSQYWAMFDHDQHPDIPEAFQTAKKHNVRIALSHPSFDLWLLLHFSPVAAQQHGSSRWINEKLRQQPAFARFGATDGDKAVRDKRVAALADKQEAAAKHARRLVDNCPTGSCSAATDHAPHCDPRKRDPSTDVWRLLMELGMVSR